ncbi:hypothetical protein MJO28_008529 [Puccinia striiformis f. sp. tritici]|uniref:Uncharacterized protein n=1 Tax=Puccinia striiformis f. sp. tritici TaxID=168172 RepID=A0ACC0EBB3_9BASI|nr:hypothetical protein MJO28_008529 [Puccinia striiformis f. sp. tritici]KAI9602861.1 hypothetical protein H4Q26_002168 [Puccinia striiformis f. sp. tritici PST-130]KAI9604631.1 hypothetical protein KEM48_002386 [Puccinia striiformis f. sp. tritici PST-130]
MSHYITPQTDVLVDYEVLYQVLDEPGGDRLAHLYIRLSKLCLRDMSDSMQSGAYEHVKEGARFLQDWVSENM